MIELQLGRSGKSFKFQKQEKWLGYSLVMIKCSRGYFFHKTEKQNPYNSVYKTSNNEEDIINDIITERLDILMIFEAKLHGSIRITQIGLMD